ncbi:MFS general substrate transporter [Myriangium duriaei CBS 260.36]|uniref:MFS general substrate transporter n=1 Tax=Myriangium duriaei CBS 260.36 TaxID=1168546 RepID=A0A9P4IYI0_9PEZI|nr:MFS general substrate transporter [Myriangium duriaei CBS 260.36]
MSRKWITATIMSAIGFITPMSPAMVAPALSRISDTLSITSAIEIQLVLSIYLLGLGTGPLFLDPLGENYGRVIVLQLANLFYLTLNTAAGAARNEAQMSCFRFLSSLGASATLVVESGVLADCFSEEDRGLAIALYNVDPLLGHPLGAVSGGFVTRYLSWRWIFYIVSILDAVLKALAALIEFTGNLHLHTLHTNDRNTGFLTSIQTSLLRSVRFLLTQHIIQILSLYLAYAYGLEYLTLSTFCDLWVTQYNEPLQIASLNFLSLGLVYLLGSVLCGYTIVNIAEKPCCVRISAFRTIHL